MTMAHQYKMLPPGANSFIPEQHPLHLSHPISNRITPGSNAIWWLGCRECTLLCASLSLCTSLWWSPAPFPCDCYLLIAKTLQIIGAWNHSWTLHDDGYPYFVESTLLSIQFVPTANTRAIDYWCSCWALLALGTFYYCWYGTARGPYVEDWNWCQVCLISFWCCIWFDLGLVFGLPKLKQYSGALDELKPGRIQSYAHFYSAWHIFSVFIFDGPLHPDMKQGKKVSTKAWWLEHYFKDMIVAFGFSHYDVHVALFTNWWITHRIYRHLARQRQNLLRWITLGLLIQ